MSSNKAKASKAKKQRANSVKGRNIEGLKGNTFRDKPERINKAGRPPKLIHHVTAELKAKGYEPLKESQLIEAYETLLQLPKDKIQEVSKSTDKPYFLCLVAKWMCENGKGMQMLEKIMDRAYGKTMMRASVDASITQEQPLFPDVVRTPIAISQGAKDGK